MEFSLYLLKAITMKHSLILLLFLFLCFSCRKNQEEIEIVDTTDTAKLFTEVLPESSHVTFKNSLIETLDFNFLNYAYIYNGGGVSVGDINNDGLQDIYFTSNQNSNILYLNKGNFKFENITNSANISDSDGWTTGTSMIDINNDGWLDIYVCKSGSLNDNELRRNKLFINQKNNTFIESAKEYGLDHNGFSTQSYFFDFDKDGDLDMYLVNHRADFSNNTKISSAIQNEIFEESSDQLFRNDGAKFTKVTAESELLNKAWGLSASVGDFNNDDWPDIYIANDYLEPDMLYINNKDGTFKNEILNNLKHTSFYSMGSDFADLNNDMLPDLLVLDMSSEDHQRSKENMATMSTESFNAMVNIGYHHQYMANVLQLNNGNSTFSDIGQIVGLSKTDWSWAPLIADFDNDGFKDIFITNGIEKDMINQDFRHNLLQLNKEKRGITLDSVLKMMPSVRLPNYIYKNNGDLTFTKATDSWGLGKKINSNGAAYADLDNDGDLDIIINNENEIASIYKNNSKNNFLNIKLIGNEKNRLGIGAKVKVTVKDKTQYQELYLNRGFQSSVSNILNFGLGDANNIEKIEVIWPDNKMSELINVKPNQQIEIRYVNADKNHEPLDIKDKITLFSKVNNEVLKIVYKHQENQFDDFSKQLLLPQKQSTPGPCLSVADVNGDKRDDFFIGGAVGQNGVLYIQNANGTFKATNTTSFESDKNSEDAGSLFFDADTDGDLDLYVTSSGYELSENDELLQDRLYLNDGNGNFTKSNHLPTMLTSTKTVKSLDFDADGDLDLVIGGNVVPDKYPLSPRSYVLQNNKGIFTDVTQNIAPELLHIGMVSDIEVFDYNNDNTVDMIVVGQWMPITVLSNRKGKFIKESIPEFEKTEGWYYSIASSDFDNDGDIDFVVGNLGMNNKFHPSLEKPLHIFSGDFDKNSSYDIALSKDYKGKLVPVRGKECSSQQTPFLNEKIKSYKEFASLDIENIYGNETISHSNHLMVYNFKTLYVENLGNGKFKTSVLPIDVQKSPTMDFEILDVNNDGFNDIVGVGNLYDAEVETIRYDASLGYVLLGTGKGKFVPLQNSGFNCNSDMREVSKINISGKTHVIVASNNDNLIFFKTSTKM
jgi:hypothetical protein